MTHCTKSSILGWLQNNNGLLEHYLINPNSFWLTLSHLFDVHVYTYNLKGMSNWITTAENSLVCPPASTLGDSPFDGTVGLYACLVWLGHELACSILNA